MATASDKAANLPYLPGYTFEKKKNSYGKTQYLSKNAGLSFIKANLKQNPPTGLNIPRPTANKTEGKGEMKSSTPEKLPAWVAYDRKVLRFYAFFKETVDGSPIETYRVRKCVFYYYLEDDSMHIAEPRQANSGISQGVFVKRHRVQKSDGSGFISAKDLKIGQNVKIYGRVFRIYECDDFTRAFYADNEMTQPASEPCPKDHFASTMNAEPRNPKKSSNTLKTFMEARLGKCIDRNTRKFLENDRKVLRFFCRWDDLSMYGETMLYILHYFLSDGTVEVLQIKENNSGRDHFPALLKRQRLPKNTYEVTPSIANIGTIGADATYYEVEDFLCGETINVFNREIKLCACDKFTSEYYKKNLNIDQVPDLPMEEESSIKRKTMKPPPHNGFGSEEDSLGSFLFLVPKVPRKPQKKVNDNGRTDLRYLAKFESPSVQDMDRRFIVTYHLNDDKIGIYEKNERNSGFIGGKFLERMKIKNPQTNEWFEPAEFFLGAVLEINKYQFRLIKADEFTLKYMEGDAGTFPHADIDRIQKQLREVFKHKNHQIRKVFRGMDEDKDGKLSYAEFKKWLFDNGFRLNDHQITTLCRRYDSDGNGDINFVEFARMVHQSDKNLL
mmetsp:Transcript_25837/g.45893  ORF Transcript_25837/g.45893 Transcript_25837/m.45893 type:complete len:613 (-) Transcript_25837:347-2185(-)|eukprot:CAMPEP_0197525034 /NCGR_PEP_ID=MMETSP1318-20131121/10576_1 /TAXON_ID=552666 /ORGANISM="Partenskyella glossopodia, Strain RCC365" /LENGTH=612 /DNA_ID=CAMNT_0043078185 /DNA_START=109 /DNA_END=1947 /DNA_ORIENTATION=+